MELGDSQGLISAYYITDNLVEGKRKRRSNLGSPSTSSSSTTPTRKGQESPRVPGVLSGKRKLVASEDERSPAKRGRKSATIKPGENIIFCS